MAENSKDWSPNELVDDVKMDSLETRAISSHTSLASREAFAPRTLQNNGRLYWVDPAYGYLHSFTVGGVQYIAPLPGTVVVHAQANVATTVANATDVPIALGLTSRNYALDGSTGATQWWNTSTNRFNPKVPGMYRLDGGIGFGSAVATGVRTAKFTLNGAVCIGSAQSVGGVASNPVVVGTRSIAVYLNGTTDYIQLVANQTSGVSNTTLEQSTNGWMASSITCTYGGFAG